jgi:hypothetical protein
MSKRELKSEFIMTLKFLSAVTEEDKARCFQIFGETPYGFQMVGRAAGGSFEGPKIKGIVHEAADWLTIRKSDQIGEVDCRNTLKTDDGVLIYMTYTGFIHGPNNFIDRWLFKGEIPDFSEYYFKTSPRFRVAGEKYSWLNGLVTVAVGETTKEGAVYDLYAIL